MINIREQFLAGIIDKDTYIIESLKSPAALLTEAMLVEGRLWKKVVSGISKTFRFIRSRVTKKNSMSVAYVLMALILILKVVKNPDDVEAAAAKAMAKAAQKGVTSPEDIKRIHREMLRSASFGTAGDYSAGATKRSIGPVLRNAIQQELGIDKAMIDEIVAASSSSTVALKNMIELLNRIRDIHPDIHDVKMDHIISMILNTAEIAQYNTGLSMNADTEREPVKHVKDFSL